MHYFKGNNIVNSIIMIIIFSKNITLEKIIFFILIELQKLASASFFYEYAFDR